MEQMEPKISINYTDEIIVVTLTAEKILEDADIQALEQSIMPLVDQNRGGRFILDFEQVKFLTSAALGLLIRVSKRVYETGGHLRLCSIQPKIMEIFRITRLDKVFEIYPDKATARESLA